MLQFCFRVCVCTHTCLSHMECCILKIVYIGGRGILNSNYILWNKKGKEIRVHLCKWESILLETLSFLQDFFTEFLSSQQNTAEIVRYYFSRSLAFVYWKIHKGKYMPVSCNKLLGKKMNECLWTCVSFPAMRTRRSEALTPALPHVGQGNNSPRLGLHRPEDTVLQGLEMQFRLKVQMFTALHVLLFSSTLPCFQPVMCNKVKARFLWNSITCGIPKLEGGGIGVRILQFNGIKHNVLKPLYN